jgi:hypothetical protein
MTNVPSYIAKRLRSPVPNGCWVVPGSTPVIAFGECQARVATLGLNPSRQEFLATNGRELSGDDRRFETLLSLGVTKLEDAKESVLQRVFDGCCKYFYRKPYRRWFDQLEGVIRPLGASYYDGTACHLDLVQWATDPVWGSLDRSIRRRLLVSDGPFLLEQLLQGQVRVLLLNGRSVIEGFEGIAGIRLHNIGCLTGPEPSPSRSLAGQMGGIVVVGWTMNLQSSFGVSSQLRSELADIVGNATETRQNSVR